LSLTTARRAAGSCFLISASALAMSSGVLRRSKPNGIPTPASRKVSRHPDLVPRSDSAGSTECSGSPSRTDNVRSHGVELKHTMCARWGSATSVRMRSSRRGRSMIFCDSDRSERSLQSSITSRLRAWDDGTPGNSDR
jgi:hypothetical protein